MLAVVILVLSALSNVKNGVNANPRVPCYFVFGDSFSDNGNNNNLKTLAKVNYPPYGIDFPKGPTGRFTNGRNMHDFIAEFLGFKQYIPSFANSEGQNILNGVNYASGSAGIRDKTGQLLGVRISLNNQIRNHKIIISKIKKLMKNDSATDLFLNRCIYSIQIGSNDYLNNYFHPGYSSIHHYTLSKYSAMLSKRLSHQLKTLYNNGARKFAMYAMGPIGCAPYAISVYEANGTNCVDKFNDGQKIFNSRLKKLVQLNNHLPDANFTYINPGSGVDISSFEMKPCCEIGGGGGELCLNNSIPCSDRRQYLFWDGVHPTEAWHEIAAKSAYNSQFPGEASPFTIQQLAVL